MSQGNAEMRQQQGLRSSVWVSAFRASRADGDRDLFYELVVQGVPIPGGVGCVIKDRLSRYWLCQLSAAQWAENGNRYHTLIPVYGPVSDSVEMDPYESALRGALMIREIAA